MRKYTLLHMGLGSKYPWNRPFRDFLVPWWIIRVGFSVSVSGSGLSLCLGVTGYQMSWRALGWLETSVSKGQCSCSMTACFCQAALLKQH